MAVDRNNDGIERDEKDVGVEGPSRPVGRTGQSPGWAESADMASQQASAIKFQRFLDDHYRRQQSVEVRDEKRQEKSHAKTWDRSPNIYAELKDSQRAGQSENRIDEQTQIEESIAQIKKDHGVRLAAALYESGVADGATIERTVDVFAKNAVEGQTDSAKIGLMQPSDFDAALGTAYQQASEAEQRQQKQSGPAVHPVTDLNQVVAPGPAASTPNPVEAAQSPDTAAMPEQHQETHSQEQSYEDKWRDTVASEMTPTRAARFERLSGNSGAEPQIEPSQERSVQRTESRSDRETREAEFQSTMVEMTDSRAARFERLRGNVDYKIEGVPRDIDRSSEQSGRAGGSSREM